MIDAPTIIQRGYVLTEEYAEMNASGKLEKLNFKYEDGEYEGIWIYPLEDSNTSGKPFHFVFFNDPVFMTAPRSVAGMVGIGGSRGHSRATAYANDCYELFKKAGEEAIDYFWSEHEKHQNDVEHES